MSYILDALKKSEQERGHGSAPTVQTIHATGNNPAVSRTPMWPYALLAAVVINLAVLFYFMLSDSTPKSAQVEPLVMQSLQTETSTAPVSVDEWPADRDAAIAEEQVAYKPVSLPVAGQHSARQPIGVEDNTTRPIMAPPDTIVQRDELPTAIQQHIPIMDFSAHVYSSNPLHRSIVINGRFMEEGDRLASDLTLNEITPKGAIFDFQGQLFHQNVVSAWN